LFDAFFFASMGYTVTHTIMPAITMKIHGEQRELHMGEAAENRRKFERFDIQAPTTLDVVGSDSQSLNLFTRDISAGGAYFLTPAMCSQGDTVKAEILIPNETISSLTGTEFQLRIHGTVVRCEETGIAVKFTGQEILPVRSTMDN
jgi:hypothetical protein